MKVAVFGTGSYADTMISQKHIDYDIYLDNNPQKWETKKENRWVLNPKEENLTEYFIIIASSCFNEIEKQLMEQGLHRYKNYISIDWLLNNNEDFIGHLSDRITYPSFTVYKSSDSNNKMLNYFSTAELIDELESTSTVDLIIGNNNSLEKMLAEERVNYIYIDDFPAQLDIKLIEQSNYMTLSVTYCEIIKRFHITEISPQHSDGIPVIICNNKLVNYLLGIKRSIISVFGEVLNDYGIPKNGIINIGVHEGQEIKNYIDLGFKSLVLIEANKEFLPAIHKKVGDIKEFLILNFAITNQIGKTSFYKTNNEGFSSSVLPLKDHALVYPDIKVNDHIEIETTTLNQLYKEFNIVRSCNALYLDVQGAEYLILSAANLLFDHIDIICTEVSFKELYEGCKLIGDIDKLLSANGFERIRVICGSNPTWGDAIYIKRKYLE